ncbi:MAG: DUF3072 domain-containing protein [Ginsengibacter sp.]
MNNENSGADNNVRNSNDQQSPNKKIQGDNTVKNPDDWSTGEEPMTGAQHSYLKTLADEAGETLDENLTKAAASKKINELQQKTGRGLKN